MQAVHEVDGKERSSTSRQYGVNPRKLEHGFRMISAGLPYTLP